jgi:hypothetical protein
VGTQRKETLMRSMPLLAVLGIVGISGCAAISFARGANPRDQLAQGALALEKHDFGQARELLEPVYYQYWERAEGQQAVLMLIAAELDGRNPERRLWAAADMAARLLQIPTLAAWMVPVVESYYTVAVELGATEQRVALAETGRANAEARASRAEQAAGTGRSKPTSPREPWPDQLKKKERELAAQKGRLSTLEAQVDSLTKELDTTKAELARIKRTIKP